jgi:hypothetical protein
MNRKCLDKEFCIDTEESPGWLDSLNNTYDVESSVKPQVDFLKLAELILQTQDGDIKKSDFHKLENWLLTDPYALKYYVEFMWLCAGLHTLLSEKRLSAITASLRSLQPQ